ncbi:protein SHQ1 homolog [Uranotaenia lowii]|uniref:protein SHQ1 homolog n=1 Tax=Uranotaenia lowii TaxID=190385 RepID=UPI002478D71A|nr:protein SHQ1 homolog [Uranotaenia lowii]
MNDALKYTLDVQEGKVIFTVHVPELDVEHEDALKLEVLGREIVFTAPPYHVRVPLENEVVLTEEVFPEKLNYEKSIITYHIPLKNVSSDSSVPDQNLFSYGFANFYSGTLNIQNSQDFRTLSNPEKFSNAARRAQRLAGESADFNGDHYGMDHVQYLIDEFGLNLNCIPCSGKTLLSDQQLRQIKLIVEEKKRTLEKYQNLEIDKPTIFNLLGIVLSVIYDKVINGNDLNEAMSHVNIHRLSPALSYFEDIESIESVLKVFYRRICIYPLYRSKNLAERCVQILIAGLREDDPRAWILDKLLYAYDAFKKNDCAILNHYFIKDFIRMVHLCSIETDIHECFEQLDKQLPKIHSKPLGFGEDNIVRRVIKEVLDIDDDSTDSDDSSESEDESEDGSSESSSESEASDIIEVVPKKTEDSVLDRLMNLKIEP